MRITKVWLSGFIDAKASFGISYRHVTGAPNLLVKFRPIFYFRLSLVYEKILMARICAYLRKRVGVKVFLIDKKSKKWGPNAKVQHVIECRERDDVYKVLEFFLPLLRSKCKGEAKQMLNIIDFHREHRDDIVKDEGLFLRFVKMADIMRETRPVRNTKYTYNYFVSEFGMDDSNTVLGKDF